MVHPKVEGSLIEINESCTTQPLVSVTVNGHKELVSLDIDPEILKEDKEMIEDMILAAVNQGLQNAGKAAEKKMNSVTGGMMGKMKFPGM